MGNKGSRWTVKGIKYFFGALIVRGIFEGARVGVNTALSNPSQEQVFPIEFSEAFRPADGWEPTATSTGNIFKYDTRIPKGGKAPPKFDATREGFKEPKDFKEKEEEDDINTIYLYDIPDKEGVMVGYNYELIDDELEKDDKPKYRIIGYEYSKMPLEKQLADIRRKNDPQISKPTGLLARGKSTGATLYLDTTSDDDVNRGKQRTSNSISLNLPEDVVEEGSVKGKDFKVPQGDGADKKVVAKGGKKMKRKKTRRKKRKGGRKKTRRKKTRKKTRKKRRKKRKKLRRKKTRRKR